MASPTHCQIGRQIVRGSVWTIGMRWALRFIGLFNTVIIARLLSPADFGLVAMTMIVVELIMLLTDAEVEMALLRDSDLDTKAYNSAWTLKIGLGLAAMVVLEAAALPVAWWFDEPRLRAVMAIVALRAGILGFENIGVVLFRRDMNFGKDFNYVVWQRLIMLGVGLGLVAVFRDWRALAWAAPVSALISVCCSFLMSSYRPRLDRSGIPVLWSFSRWQIGYNLARFLVSRFDQFLIGTLVGANAAGLYYVACDIATTTTREVVQPLGRALIPTLGRVHRQPDALDASFHPVLAWVAIVCSAAGCGGAVVASDAVRLLLGQQWTEAVWFFQWTALYGALEGLALLMEPFLIVRREERLLSLITIGQATITVLALWLGASHLGILAIPLIRIATMTGLLLVMIQAMVRRGWLCWRDFAAALWRPVIAGAVMAVVVAAQHDATIAWPLLSLVRDVMMGIAAYVLVILSLWWGAGRPPGPERLMVEFVGGHWDAWRQRRVWHPE